MFAVDYLIIDLLKIKIVFFWDCVILNVEFFACRTSLRSRWRRELQMAEDESRHSVSLSWTRGKKTSIIIILQCFIFALYFPNFKLHVWKLSASFSLRLSFLSSCSDFSPALFNSAPILPSGSSMSNQLTPQLSSDSSPGQAPPLGLRPGHDPMLTSPPAGVTAKGLEDNRDG